MRVLEEVQVERKNGMLKRNPKFVQQKNSMYSSSLVSQKSTSTLTVSSFSSRGSSRSVMFSDSSTCSTESERKHEEDPTAANSACFGLYDVSDEQDENDHLDSNSKTTNKQPVNNNNNNNNKGRKNSFQHENKNEDENDDVTATLPKTPSPPTRQRSGLFLALSASSSNLNAQGNNNNNNRNRTCSSSKMASPCKPIKGGSRHYSTQSAPELLRTSSSLSLLDGIRQCTEPGEFRKCRHCQSVYPFIRSEPHITNYNSNTKESMRNLFCSGECYLTRALITSQRKRRNEKSSRYATGAK